MIRALSDEEQEHLRELVNYSSPNTYRQTGKTGIWNDILFGAAFGVIITDDDYYF